MSNVFRAHDRLLERTVALKILHEQYTRDEDYVERFRREARAVAQLAHPNIVTVIDRGEQDGRQFIVFEYVDGQNLKELTAGGPLDAREAIGLALQVGAGALLRARARPRAPRREAAERAPERRRPGEGDRLRDRALAGRARRHADRDRARDERLHRARAGPRAEGRPEDGHLLARRGALRAPDRRRAVLGRQLRRRCDAARERASAERARPTAGLSARLDLAIQRAMAKDPEERFASMDEFCAELEACLAELDGRGGRGRDDDRPAATEASTGEEASSSGPGFPGQPVAARPARRAARGRRRVPAAPRRRRRIRSSQRTPLRSRFTSRSRRLRPLRHRRRARRGGRPGNRSKPRDVLGQRALRQLQKAGVGLVLQGAPIRLRSRN